MSANTLDPAALLNWDFDVFNASTQWPNNYLAVVGDSAFRALNLHVTFKIGDECLGNWLDAVQQMYLDNPYHNALHVADVTQAVVFFLHSCELGQLLEPIEVLACVVSALVHDLGHFGKTNNFLKATNHDLALRFSDQSILENFHVSEGWKLCVDPKHNIFESLSENELGKVHELMVMMILDTDMARHAKITDTFATTIVGAEDLTLQDHRRLIMSMILHCADLANGSRTPRLSQNWSSMVMEEFFSQGDEEKRLGLPVSPNMDRDGGEVLKTKCQMTFLTFVIEPMFKSWGVFLQGISAKNGTPAAADASQVFLHNISANIEYWTQNLAALCPEEAGAVDSQAVRQRVPA